MRKLITSIGMAGVRAVNLANVTGTFGGASLCRILTDYNWGDRVLGENLTWSGRMPTVWFATANNPSIGADMFRRIASIRLDWGRLGITSPEQLPSDYWRHKDVLKYALDNRPKLVVAALTILRYFFANGSPEQQTSEWGSYPAWQRVILGALCFAGLPDPGAARASLRKRADYASNLETQLLMSLTWLFESVGKGKPMLAADVLNHVASRTGTLDAPREGLNFSFATEYDALGEALRGLTSDDNAFATRGEPAQLPNSRQLGKLLARLNGTLFDISPRVRPPDPPHELVTAAATVQEQSVCAAQDKRTAIGTKSPDGTMVWRDTWGEQWRRLPDGQTQMWHGGQWGSLWRLRLPHHPGATWWRISGTAGEVEMWVPESNQWIPQPRVKVRVVQVDKDSSGRGLWCVERWEK